MISLNSFKSKRKFGVEIEVNQSISPQYLSSIVSKSLKVECYQEDWGYTCNNNYWVVKPDSSCGDNGIGKGYEIISPASSGIKHLKRIEKAADVLRVKKAKANDYCGFHCQVEIADFSKVDVACLLAWWIKMEPIVACMLPSRRINNIYCRLFCNKKSKLKILESLLKHPEDFAEAIAPKTLDRLSKRTSITVVNYFRTLSKSYSWKSFNRPTVELRLPESSLNGYDVKNWSRFFIQFVECVYKKELPNDFKPMNLDQFFNFLNIGDEQNTILSAGMLETKLWILFRINQHSSKKTVSKDALNTFNLLWSDKCDWRYPFPKVS